MDVAPYVYLGCYKDNGDSDSEGPIEYRDIKVLVNEVWGNLKCLMDSNICTTKLHYHPKSKPNSHYHPIIS